MWKKRDEDLIKAFGKRLKRMRKVLGLTQQAMADALQLAVSTISHCERGRSLFTPAVMVKLHDVYGVSLDYLLLGKGEMFLGRDDAERFDQGGHMVSELRKDYEGKLTFIGIRREGDFNLELTLGDGVDEEK